MPYNGSIDVISGLRPKNNNDFPLVKAHDVYVDDDTRLDTLLSAIGGAPGSSIRMEVRGRKLYITHMNQTVSQNTLDVFRLDGGVLY